MAEQLNKYQRKTIQVQASKESWIPVEGVGIGGSYKMKGNIDISQFKENLWRAQVYIQIKILNPNISGTINPFGTVDVYLNGSKQQEIALKVTQGVKVIESTWLEVGTASFFLPPSGSIEAGVNAGYVLVGDAGRYIVNNLSGKILSNVSKKLGEFFGYVRFKIY